MHILKVFNASIFPLIMPPRSISGLHKANSEGSATKLCILKIKIQALTFRELMQ